MATHLEAANVFSRGFEGEEIFSIPFAEYVMLYISLTNSQ